MWNLSLTSACCRHHPQSEYGDIYKATLEYSGEAVSELKVKYFDSLPPCISLAVLKTGFLFCASETGNHALYQFVVSGTARGGGCLAAGIRLVGYVYVYVYVGTASVYVGTACYLSGRMGAAGQGEGAEGLKQPGTVVCVCVCADRAAVIHGEHTGWDGPGGAGRAGASAGLCQQVGWGVHGACHRC